MRAVFMGTPDFAVPTLEAMIEAGHEVVAVFTQPDKPKGRGGKMQFPPVKEKALEHNIPVYQPVKIREPEYVQILTDLQPEVVVVVAFGQILPKTILDIPTHGCINVHASLLPKYRGAAPIQWVIIDGEKETGVTTMFMDVGLDTGDMLLKTVIPMDEKETGGSLHDKLCAAGGKLLVETLEQLEAGTLQRIPQEGETCYASMLTKELGHIDWTKPAVEIERLIRGLNPWPSAYTSLDGKTMKIWAASVLNKEAAGACGEIIAVDKHGFEVQTGAGVLKIESLQLEGKKRMDADAFLRGYSLQTGTILG